MSLVPNDRPLRQREPRVRDKAHLGFVAKLPCLGCMCKGRGERWPVEVCHIRIGFPEAGWREFGRSERPHDQRTYPGCPWCHRLDKDAQHNTNERDWFEGIGVYPPALVAALREAFETGADGRAVIRRAANGAFPFPALD